MKVVRASTFVLAAVAVALSGAALLIRNGLYPGAPPVDAAVAAVRSFAAAGSTSDTARMDAQITILRAMHDRMTAARTPAERDVSMATRTNAIRSALKVMNEMPSGSLNDSQDDGVAQRRMLDKRLELTQIALQLAIGQLAVAPLK